MFLLATWISALPRNPSARFSNNTGPSNGSVWFATGIRGNRVVLRSSR